MENHVPDANPQTENKVKRLKLENVLLYVTITATVLVILVTGMVVFLMISVLRLNQFVTSLRNELESIQTSKLSKTNSTDVSGLQVTVKNHEETIRDLKSKLEEPKGIGATYIRWGRAECPGNGSEIVYSGYIGGSYYNHPGAASNHLCLPNEPQYHTYNGTYLSEGRVYGAEFDTHNSETFFGKDLRYHVPPCAVCRSPRTSVFMIPARITCYNGWTKEFGGYLVSGHYRDEAATEYICVDKNATFTEWSNPAIHNGRRLCLVEGICYNNLKCPPYQDQKELSCVVCSK